MEPADNSQDLEPKQERPHSATDLLADPVDSTFGPSKPLPFGLSSRQTLDLTPRKLLREISLMKPPLDDGSAPVHHDLLGRFKQVAEDQAKTESARITRLEHSFSFSSPFSVGHEAVLGSTATLDMSHIVAEDSFRQSTVDDDDEEQVDQSILLDEAASDSIVGDHDGAAQKPSRPLPEPEEDEMTAEESAEAAPARSTAAAEPAKPNQASIVTFRSKQEKELLDFLTSSLSNAHLKHVEKKDQLYAALLLVVQQLYHDSQSRLEDYKFAQQQGGLRAQELYQQIQQMGTGLQHDIKQVYADLSLKATELEAFQRDIQQLTAEIATLTDLEKTLDAKTADLNLDLETKKRELQLEWERRPKNLREQWIQEWDLWRKQAPMVLLLTMGFLLTEIWLLSFGRLLVNSLVQGSHSEL
ncbi:hypothetical protein HDV03_000838 [Kappamyces sp. JEL0829]|nr:hypothetical protein HDV03_000838 [Kappamyces sp. JEL0829]